MIGGPFLTRIALQGIRKATDNMTDGTYKLFFPSQCSVSAQLVVRGYKHSIPAGLSGWSGFPLPQIISTPPPYFMNLSLRVGYFYVYGGTARLLLLSYLPHTPYLVLQNTLLPCMSCSKRRRTSINPACLDTKLPPIITGILLPLLEIE